MGTGGEQGKGKGISRRDFLDGVAITSAGLAAAAAPPRLAGAEAKLAAALGTDPTRLPLRTSAQDSRASLNSRPLEASWVRRGMPS